MPLSKTLSDYEDIRPKFDRALASPRGIRIGCNSHGEAVHLRSRFYAMRKLERTASLDIFEFGDFRRGTSAYDCLTIKVEDLSIIILKQSPLTVEEL